MKQLTILLILLSFSAVSQDTLQYKNYIDYERKDHLAMVKNTILTRDGNFLRDGLYNFKGNREDFMLLLLTNGTLLRRNLTINDTTELFLIGEIKDSIKAGIWTLKIKNIDTENHSAIIDSIRIENYLHLGTPREARYRYYDNYMKCNIKLSGYIQDIRCRDVKNNIQFGESNTFFKELPDYGVYRRNVSCKYLVEKNGNSLLYQDHISIESRKNHNDTIKTHIRIDTPFNYRFVQIDIIEVIKDNKLVYFNIDEDRRLSQKMEDELKEYNFYPEIMYNLAPCWELGR